MSMKTGRKFSLKNLRLMERGLPPTQSEEDFQKQVIAFARLRGWRVAHFRASVNQRGKWQTAVQGDGSGFPDLVLVRQDRCIWAELKTDTGEVTDAQEGWITALETAHQLVYVWRPKHWDKIVEMLT